MMNLRSLALAAALLVALALPAPAQQYNGPNGPVSGVVPMCMGPTGRAVTCPEAITGRGSGTTGAVVGTIAAAVGKTSYLCSFDVSAIGGTAAVGPIVVAGLIGGSFTYQLSSTASGVTLTRHFTPCIPASAVNTAITITTTADGTASAVNVNATGYQR